MNSLRTSLLILLTASATFADDGQLRPAVSDEVLKSWLQNMVWHHRYTKEELQQVTGLSNEQLTARLNEFNISDATRPPRKDDRLVSTAGQPPVESVVACSRCWRQEHLPKLCICVGL